MDGQGAFGTIGRGDQTEPTTLLRLTQRKLLVTRLQPLAFRQQPDLVEMDTFLVRGVELAVAHAGAGGHALQFTGLDDRAVAHAVLVCERPVEDVGDDLHVPMAVHPEPLTGRNPVVVDDPQGAEARVGGVVVIAEGKRVPGVEPAVVEVASLGSLADLDHDRLLLFTCKLFIYQVNGKRKSRQSSAPASGSRTFSSSRMSSFNSPGERWPRSFWCRATSGPS